MASFRKAQDIPSPSLSEIHGYKTYLASSRLLSDDETKFLDLPDDLVSLAKEEPTRKGSVADDGITMPRSAEEVALPASRSRKASESEAGSCAWTRRNGTRAQETLGVQLAQLALAMSIAVFVPIAAFAAIPGFARRIAVVTLVGASVAMALVHSGHVRLLDRGSLDWVICAVVYGGAMAAVAGALA